MLKLSRKICFINPEKGILEGWNIWNIGKISIKFKFVLIIITILFAGLNGFGQKVVRTTGKAQVRMETNMTTDQAYEQAEQLAMINAIENAFGTYVEQQMDMTIEEGKTAYNIIGTTKVKGDWIETIDIDFRENVEVESGKYGKKQNVKYVSCNIKGRVRESISKANLEYIVMNCPDQACRTFDFYDGEQLYLYFKSPVNGYVSVYVDEGDITYRLLPYVTMGDEYQSGVKVEGDVGYTFFSESKNIFDNAIVDEIEMYTNKKLEYNNIYIIFAEEAFVKPVLNDKELVDNRILPKSLESEKFQEWLQGNRASSPSFQEHKIKISIKHK